MDIGGVKMSTYGLIKYIPIDKVKDVLKSIVTNNENRYAVLYSLVQLYELEIILVSNDAKADIPSDLYGMKAYGSEWYFVKNVSIASSYYVYDKQMLIDTLSNVVKSTIIPKILKARDFNDVDISGYMKRLQQLLEELKNE